MEASVVRESITSFIVCQEGVIPCKTRGGKLLKTMELKKHVATKGLTSATVDISDGFGRDQVHAP